MQFSGVLYHVTARGKERKPIFRDERDRPAQVRKYLSPCLPAHAPARSAWRSAIPPALCWCWEGNPESAEAEAVRKIAKARGVADAELIRGWVREKIHAN